MVIIESKKVGAYQAKSLEEKMEHIHDLVDKTIKQVNLNHKRDAEAYLTDAQQDEVIARIAPKINGDFINDLGMDVLNWVSAKEGVLSQYLRDRTNFIEQELKSRKKQYDKKMYVKVTARCNSLGGDEVLSEDLIHWIDGLREIALDSTYLSRMDSQVLKYLKNKSKQEQMLSSLKKMIAFPVTVKETEVNYYQSESKIQENLRSVFAPICLANDENLTSKIIAASNVVVYRELNGDLIHRIDGRLKINDNLKWAKYLVGLTNPFFDSAAFMETIPKIKDVPRIAYEIINNHALSGNGKPEIDHRYRGINLTKSKIHREPYSNMRAPNLKELSEVRIEAIRQMIDLLKNPYVGENGKQRSIIREAEKIICGEWIDFKEKTTKSPLEVQVKDVSLQHLYTNNSPLGHNSVDYDNRRQNKVTSELIEKGKDKIFNYLNNEVLIPVFNKNYTFE